MTDEELVTAFESTTLPASEFTHENHVRVAWCYLQQEPLLHALTRFSTSLRRFATAHGAAGKYHETITVGYMLIIADRLHRMRTTTWPDFAAANPDLFANPSPLTNFYTDTRLASAEARATFQLPDAPVSPTSHAVLIER